MSDTRSQRDSLAGEPGERIPPEGKGRRLAWWERFRAAGGIPGKRLLLGLLAGLAGLIVAGVLALAGVLDPFEARTFDWRARLLAPNDVSNSVRLIMLDQASLDWGAKENGLSWPWPREVYGVIVDFCRRAGAASVAFDVLYTEPSSYGVSDDAALASAGKRYGRLVLPVFLGRETGQATTWPASAPAEQFTIKNLTQWVAGKSGLTAPRAAFPVPDVAPAAALLANVSQDPDADGVYRRVGLFSLFDGRTVPTLALGAYALAHPHTRMNLKGSRLRLGETRIPLDADGRAIPRWRSEKAFPAVSAAAVIQSELALREGGQPLIDPAVLKDKIVLFGFSAPGLLDLRPSPVAGVTSGTEIHAQVLESLVRGDFLRETPVAVGWILAALLGLGAGVAATMAANALGSATAMAVFLPLPVLLALAGQAWLGLWLPLALPETAAAAALGVGVLIAYATEGRQKRFIKTAFRQYLSPDVIEQLIAHPERMSLGGELRELTIFFSDLQGFTGISEKLDPKGLTRLLNEYLTAMTDIILEEGGTVDKYEGDAIIAFWNAPLTQPDHALRAVRAALRCQDKLAALRPHFRQVVDKDLHMRVGLNTGPAVVGNMGSSSRFDYTMLGDAVNLASRLEGVNKQFGTYTMMSDATRQAVGEALAARQLATVAVVGRAEPVAVYEPLWPETARKLAPAHAAYAAALAAFTAGDFQTALTGFAALADTDPAAASYLDRCRHCLASPPDDWCGVCVMTSK